MSLLVVSVMPDPYYGNPFFGMPDPYGDQFVGMPNPYAYQSAYERGYLLCTEFVRLRNWCTNNYASKSLFFRTLKQDLVFPNFSIERVSHFKFYFQFS